MRAGDIGLVAKLKETLTGDTVCSKTNCVTFRGVELPEPSIAYAVSAKSRNDEDRLSTALGKILEEDLTLRFYRDPQTKEFLLAGNGQQHLEVVVSRLKRRYGVEVELKSPKIPYRETVRGSASVQGRHKKQTGGHGQFGDCWIKLEPLPRGEKFQFVNDIFGGAIPRNFIPAVEKGIFGSSRTGLSGWLPCYGFSSDCLRRFLSRCGLIGNGLQTGWTQSVSSSHATGEAGTAGAGYEGGRGNAGGFRGRFDERLQWAGAGGYWART